MQSQGCLRTQGVKWCEETAPRQSQSSAETRKLWQFKTWHLPATKAGRAKMATPATWLGGTSCCDPVVAAQAGPAGAASGPITAGRQTRWAGCYAKCRPEGRADGVVWLEEEQSLLGAGRGRAFTTARGLRLAMVCAVGVE